MDSYIIELLTQQRKNKQTNKNKSKNKKQKEKNQTEGICSAYVITVFIVSQNSKMIYNMGLSL
jgi:hypothetical protein